MLMPIFSPWVEDARWLRGPVVSFFAEQKLLIMPSEVPQPLFDKEREEISPWAVGDPSYIIWEMLNVFFFSLTIGFGPVLSIWPQFFPAGCKGFNTDVQWSSWGETEAQSNENIHPTRKFL